MPENGVTSCFGESHLPVRYDTTSSRKWDFQKGAQAAVELLGVLPEETPGHFTVE